MSGGKIDQIDWEKFKPFFSLISKNIGIQKARVGGNFAIAQAVQSRDQREHIRKTLPDVVFIVMSLTKGQLISKCPFGVIDWTKIPTKKIDNFCPTI